jgi:flavodoxin II
LSKIGLFYGSSTCYTEIAAEKIQAQFGNGEVTLFNLADSDIEKSLNFEYLIFGIPTWDYGELQEDWEEQWDALTQMCFQGKTVALYGLGDQVGYPQWFQDALGYLHDQLIAAGARVVGYWPADGYQFEESKALTDDGNFFVGLALDEENEFDLSEARIAQWCAQIKTEFTET